jgi:site-specific DNA-cytosine methylase
VQQHFDVLAQLEPHQFGTATASKNWGVVVDESPSSSWEASYSGMKFPLIYGNPRCTAFSSLTGGCDASTHGPFAKQCADINEFMSFALGKGDILIWESVQQAYSVGKPLIDHWVKQCEDFQYRVAHVFINAATFGNAQQRKRYFFVAYKSHLKFNVDAPEIEDAYATVWDVISHLRDRECYPMNSRDLNYTRDSFKMFKPDLVEAIPLIATGMCLNSAVAHAYADMPERLREKWDSRTSSLPFSLHSPRRLAWMRP